MTIKASSHEVSIKELEGQIKIFEGKIITIKNDLANPQIVMSLNEISLKALKCHLVFLEKELKKFKYEKKQLESLKTIEF